MQVRFHLYYRTQHGESLWVLIQPSAQPLPMEYLNEDMWGLHIDLDDQQHATLQYRYLFQDRNGNRKEEWETRRSVSLQDQPFDTLHTFDTWNPPGALENAFDTQPFRDIFLRRPQAVNRPLQGAFTHIFRVKAPLLSADQCLCLLGHGAALRNWDTAAPLLLHETDGWWTIRLDLSREHFPLAYKYGVWNTRTNKFLGFESGANRTLYTAAGASKEAYLLHDGFARLPNDTWRGAGVAIPVFSLRSANSWGVGEFADLPALADWAHGVGLKLIQLLPVNDTSATGAKSDSYPYAAISAFALHPMYLNLPQMAGKAHAALLKPFAKEAKKLNALPAVDYEAVMLLKWTAIKAVFEAEKKNFFQDEAFQAYFKEQQHWLAPYAAFCYLRDKYGATDFYRWPEHSVFQANKIEKLIDPKSKAFDGIALHYFVQWHLHLQLRQAVSYAHETGLALKGDIPIGIYRYSCDAWTAPERYNMDQQSGAPPDDFAEKGQNWGFPTYNWTRMKEDGFSWWRKRFQQMSLYFDAFRIDHILGFFRIWSIPADAAEGILGHFVPAIPVSEQELRQAGIPFQYERFCRPWINERVLWEELGDPASGVAEQFLLEQHNGTYKLRPEFDTQIKIKAHFAKLPDTEENRRLQNGLFNLIANVMLLDTPEAPYDPDKGWHGAFRFGMDKTRSFQELDSATQSRLQALYIDYFFRRQDDFWQGEAMEKLPALKRSTSMLICGEDLGMVPHCVPDVMSELGILSLEVQRMPKKQGARFFHPKDAPYLSVVTPSTHDMSTIRGWWEEDRTLIQQFFNEVMQQWGNAPFFCEPWVNRALLEQHLHSPAMWAIFQMQDLLGMDGQLRRENPQEERINIPADPNHYWRYRIHLSLEELQKAAHFNGNLKQMIAESGR
jgi:4-alpha-glucanotransferase